MEPIEVERIAGLLMTRAGGRLRRFAALPWPLDGPDGAGIGLDRGVAERWPLYELFDLATGPEFRHVPVAVPREDGGPGGIGAGRSTLPRGPIADGGG